MVEEGVSTIQSGGAVNFRFELPGTELAPWAGAGFVSPPPPVLPVLSDAPEHPAIAAARIIPAGRLEQKRSFIGSSSI